MLNKSHGSSDPPRPETSETEVSSVSEEPNASLSSDVVSDLVSDLRALIDGARLRAATTVNRELVLLYFDIGHRLRQEVLADGRRAEYGERIVATLSQQFTEAYGQGFTKSSLTRMMQLAEYFPARTVVEKLADVLSWSHFVEILPLRDPLEREFYASLCLACRWSVRGLRKEISSALFTRTALSRNTDELVRQELAKLRDEDQWTPDTVFRDPYLLPFLGLGDAFSEKDLEAALVREMERFLLELGEGFAFVARQKRMVIDGQDFYLDLLFFHRGLRRLVAIELKVGKFEPGFKGQLELYLRWLDNYERKPGEEPPIGLILCTEAGPEQMALLQIGQSDIHVAEYITQNLPPALLEQKLKEAERRGRAQITAREDTEKKERK